MRRPGARIGAGHIGYAVLVAGVVLLAIHCRRITESVLGREDGASPAAATETPADITPEQRLTERDGVVLASMPGRRDPFRPPVLRGAPSATGVAEIVEPEPELGVLLYDAVSPQVQLRIGGNTSGWLRAGDSFGKWTVVQIGPTSVRITNGSRMRDLSSS